jgi:hypothetical protein
MHDQSSATLWVPRLEKHKIAFPVSLAFAMRATMPKIWTPSITLAFRPRAEAPSYGPSVMGSTTCSITGPISCCLLGRRISGAPNIRSMQGAGQVQHQRSGFALVSDNGDSGGKGQRNHPPCTFLFQEGVSMAMCTGDCKPWQVSSFQVSLTHSQGTRSRIVRYDEPVHPAVEGCLPRRAGCLRPLSLARGSARDCVFLRVTEGWLFRILADPCP